MFFPSYFVDKRFAVQARMTGALQVSLNVAKHNPQNFKVLHPVLQVLKIYANSRKYLHVLYKFDGDIEVWNVGTAAAPIM